MPSNISFRPRNDQEDALNKLIEEKGSQTEAGRYLLDLHIQKENKFAFLDNSCPALCQGDKEYLCVWGREGRPPQITKLGIERSSISDICDSCKETLKLKEENKQLKAQIEHGVVVQIPSCANGGRISDDGKKLWCPRTMQYEDVHKWCKVLKGGANCEHLRWTQIVAKDAYKPEKNR